MRKHTKAIGSNIFMKNVPQSLDIRREGNTKVITLSGRANFIISKAGATLTLCLAKAVCVLLKYSPNLRRVSAKHTKRRGQRRL